MNAETPTVSWVFALTKPHTTQPIIIFQRLNKTLSTKKCLPGTSISCPPLHKLWAPSTTHPLIPLKSPRSQRSGEADPSPQPARPELHTDTGRRWTSPGSHWGFLQTHSKVTIHRFVKLHSVKPDPHKPQLLGLMSPFITLLKNYPGLLAHIYDTSTLEAEAGGLPRVQPGWATQRSCLRKTKNPKTLGSFSANVP